MRICFGSDEGGLGGWCVALCVLVGLGIERLDGLEEKSRIEDG